MSFDFNIPPDLLNQLTRFNESIDFLKNQKPEKRWFDEDEAAEYLSVKKWTIQEWRKKGKITPVVIGEIFRYDIKDLDAFMELHKCTPFAEKALQQKKSPKLKVA